jgi:hypothetical protein
MMAKNRRRKTDVEPPLMTEAEWLACARPHDMLNLLKSKNPSARKLRLFSSACCRRIRSFLENARCLHLIETSDRYADGLASEAELEEAGAPIGSAHLEDTGNYDSLLDPWNGIRAVWYLMSTESPEACLGFERILRAVPSRKAEEAAQSSFLRDIFGNPFRPMPNPHPSWLTWNNGAVPKLAGAIYDERGFDRMPILADALEEAGCDDADLLSHCRSGGEHVRGCWVVDLLLGKK